MLSYRHAFHAGNFADVLKHLVLANVLDYLCRKPGPLLYVDTHAGAGEYPLQGTLNREAKEGVLRLDFDALQAALPAPAGAALAIYQRAVAPFLARGRYPGSPALAAALLRPQDRLRLYELHPAEHQRLEAAFRGDRRIKCEHTDGFGSARALLPPAGMRAVVLVDPPYEVKDDYRNAAQYMRQAWERMPHAVLLLWYPVLAARRHETLPPLLGKGGIRDLWQVELGVGGLQDEGMHASGLLLVNPPWQLPEHLRHCLPALARQLAGTAGCWRVDRLTAE